MKSFKLLDIPLFFVSSSDSLFSMKNNIRVFVVEDAPFLREILCRILTEAGIEVVGMAECVDLALSQIKNLQPDLVLMDLVLPGKNGLALINKIYKISPETEIIVCSSLLSHEEVLLKCEMIGVMNFVNKPFSSTEMLDMIFSVVKQTRHEEMAA